MNEFYYEEDYAIMLVPHRNFGVLKVKLDIEDVARVSKYRWYAQWKKDINDFIFYNQKPKMSLRTFIKNVVNENSNTLYSVNGDRFDFRKNNLKFYAEGMTNDYYQLDNSTIAILIKQGNFVHECLIDVEDFEKVNKIGYTWQVFESQKDTHIYAFNRINYKNEAGKLKQKQLLLHRLIMDCIDPLFKVDHKNHNTLDNRKQNLSVVNHSENQLNRNGSRKGSKSGVRGVSWDQRNKDLRQDTFERSCFPEIY